MEILQERIASNADASASIVFIDGLFECFHIEDEYRPVKVAKETRIPAGRYQISVRTFGDVHSRYLEKFGPGFHSGMLEIMNVPGFTDILIHIGNLESNTDGCQLTNAGAMIQPDEIKGMASTEAYRRFYLKVIDAALSGNLWITIVDRDHGNAMDLHA